MQIDEKFVQTLERYFAPFHSPTLEQTLQFSRDWSGFEGINDSFFQESLKFRFCKGLNQVIENQRVIDPYCVHTNSLNSFMITCDSTNNLPTTIIDNHYVAHIYIKNGPFGTIRRYCISDCKALLTSNLEIIE